MFHRPEIKDVVIHTSNASRLGDLVLKIGSADFGGEYFRLFNETLAIEHCTVFSFRADERPAALVMECNAAQDGDQVRRLAHEYVTGAFHSDPNIRRELKTVEPLVYTLRAGDVRDAAYRHRFYEEPALSHELVLLGRLNGTLYYSSFYRGNSAPEFGADELGCVQQLAEFAIKALQRHVELNSRGITGSSPASAHEDTVFDGNRRAAFKHLKEVLLCGPRKLSPREAEVCAAIVLGYSTLAISLNLGISLNTVATHRKRAYSKLGVCSQNELFGQYFRIIAKFDSLRE